MRTSLDSSADHPVSSGLFQRSSIGSMVAASANKEGKDVTDDPECPDVIDSFDEILGGSSQNLVSNVIASVRELFDEAGKALLENNKAQIQGVMEENTALKERLNLVLSATWRFTEEGWQGHGPPLKIDDLTGPLTLAPASRLNNGDGSSLWEVPPDFDPHEAKIHALQATSDKIHEFETRPHWNGHEEDIGSQGIKRQSTTAIALHKRYTMVATDTSNIRPKRGIGALILHPDGKQKTWWDCLSAVMIFYDFVTVPWALFDFPDTAVTKAISLITIAFWTLDMVVSCFTGYRLKNDKVMLEPWPVIKRYMIRQFLLDVLVNGVDWAFFIVELASENKSKAGDTGRILKMRRFVRVVRLYRLVKLARVRRVIFLFMQKTESDLVFVLPLFLRILVITVLSGHVLGSLWFAVGLVGQATDATYNWIDAYELEERDWFYRYSLAFWFVINKLLLGDSNVQPQNALECAFGLMLVVLGIIFFFYLSAMSLRSFSTLFNIRSDSFKEFFMLRAYLRQHKVPANLAFRVTTYAENVCKPQLELIPAKKLLVVPLLSQQLRCELNVSVEYSAIFTHPLFELCQDTPDIMQGFGNPANNVLKNQMLASGDSSFSAGTRAKHMRIVASGQLHYVKGGTCPMDCIVKKGDWLCEPAIWTVWTHQGDCCASTDGQCVMVDVHNFWEVVERDVIMFSLMSKYAHFYVEELNQNYPVSLADPTTTDYDVRRLIDQAKEDPSKGMAMCGMASLLTQATGIDWDEPEPPLYDPPMVDSR
jgi:hypothetical protein